MGVLRSTIFLPTLRLQFGLSFGWPSFSVPRFQWAFLVSVALIVVQYGLKVAKKLLRYALVHTTALQLSVPMKVSKFEQWVMWALSMLR